MKKLVIPIATFAVCIAVMLSTTELAYASGGYDDDGYENITKIVDNKCAKDFWGGCPNDTTRYCRKQDYVRYNCKSGTGNCQVTEVKVGDVYAGSCYKTPIVVGFILYLGRCLVGAGSSCGGNCECQ